MFHAVQHTKPRLRRPGVVANPCDTTGCRCRSGHVGKLIGFLKCCTAWNTALGVTARPATNMLRRRSVGVNCPRLTANFVRHLTPRPGLVALAGRLPARAAVVVAGSKRIGQVLASTVAMLPQEAAIDEGRHAWIEPVLRRFEYRRLLRAVRGSVLACKECPCGFSRAQIKRLILRWDARCGRSRVPLAHDGRVQRARPWRRASVIVGQVRCAAPMAPGHATTAPASSVSTPFPHSSPGAQAGVCPAACG